MSEFVRVEVEGQIATIRLDRPKMNALNAQLQDELAGRRGAGHRGRRYPRGHPLRR